MRMDFCSALRIPAAAFPSDKLERIFDEYYQVDQSGTQRSGVGLGLAIVREVSRLLSYSVRSPRRLAGHASSRPNPP